MPARKVNLHPIAMLHLGPLQRVLKLQRINCTTVVATSIPDDAANITDGGQDWTATVVSYDIMII